MKSHYEINIYMLKNEKIIWNRITQKKRIEKNNFHFYCVGFANV